MVELKWISDKENAVISALIELVDIPVSHRVERIPLSDMSSMENNQRNVSKGKECRKWKRVKNKQIYDPRSSWGVKKIMVS